MIRVAHVSRYLKSREMKLAIGLYQQAEVEAYHLGELSDTVSNIGLFKEHVVTGKIMDRESFHEGVRFLEPKIDLWHCHNEPDYFVPLVKESSKKPVIWDVHDLNSVRTGCCRADEALSFEKCDGILTVGGPIEEICRVKSGRDIPITSYRTLCPLPWFPPLKDPIPGKVVIATGLNSKPENYRNWKETFEKIISMGYDLEVYSGFFKIPEAYQVPYVHKAIPIPELLKKFSDAQAGLCGSPYRNPLMDIANPNKLYEYVAAGIPSICIGKGIYMSQVMAENNLGISIDNFELEFSAAMNAIEKIPNLRQHIQECRDLYSMEEETDNVVEFYKKFI